MRSNPHVECTHAVLLYVTVVLGISVLVKYMEVTEICNWNFPNIFSLCMHMTKMFDIYSLVTFGCSIDAPKQQMALNFE